MMKLFIVLLVAVSVSCADIDEPVTTVLGVAGGRTSLPCNLSSPHANDAVTLILWYKDDTTTPIYSLDARKGNLEKARHSQEEVLQSRSYMNTISRPAVLDIESLTVDDGGEYRCRVDFRKARTRNSLVFLKIIIPPNKPVITDSSGQPQPAVISNYNEGDRLRLVCEVDGGQPTPSLTWWRESVLLDDTYEVSGPTTVRNELEIPVIQRHDLMAVFTCQASNNNISIPSSTAVTLDVNFRPSVVRIETVHRPLSADKTVEIVCSSAGSRPPATITWWKGTAKLKKAREKVSVDGNVTTSILTITPTADDSGKFLSCRAENSAIQSSAMEDGWKLDVHFVPQLSLRLGSKLRHSHIQEGNDVYFECNIRAAPWITEVRWWFEGREIHTNTSAGVIVSNQSLVLQKVHRTQRGRYTCSAMNSEGEGESNSVHLRVQYAPVCKTHQKALYGAARHEAVKIICEVDADPPDVTFRWAFNGTGDPTEGHVITHTADKDLSIATFAPRSELDYGTVLCWARNPVGQQQEPCAFVVIPAGPPDPVKNCSIVNVTEDTIRVDCSEGYDGGLLQHFVLEVHDTVAHKLRANITGAWPSFVAKRLQPATSFLVVIYAVNAKGRSKGVALTASTLAMPESMTRLGRGHVWQLKFSPVLALLIAVVCTAVFIAFVIIIVMKMKSGNHRLREGRAKNRKNSKTTSNDNNKTSMTIRKSVDDICDVCTCGGDPDDKCPDIIPDISLASSEPITRNSELDDDFADDKLNGSMTTPLTAGYGNGGVDGHHHHHRANHHPNHGSNHQQQQQPTHWRASPPPSPPPNHLTHQQYQQQYQLQPSLHQQFVSVPSSNHQLSMTSSPVLTAVGPANQMAYQYINRPQQQQLLNQQQQQLLNPQQQQLLSQQQQQFSTLQHPRRVRVLPQVGGQIMRSQDDLLSSVGCHRTTTTDV